MTRTKTATPVATVDATLDKGSRAPRPETSGDSMLAQYFRDMALHPVMGPDKELDTARDVESAEVDHWVALLAHPPAAKYILDALKADLAARREKPKTPQIQVLLRAIKGWRKAQCFTADQQEQQYCEKCGELALAVRLADSDRVWMTRARQIAKDLVREPDLGPEGLGGEGGEFPTLPILDRTDAYSRYLGRIQATFEHQLLVKNRFVKANLRLVVSIARRHNRGRMPLIDLIQEGNVGLMKAVEQFDHRRGYRFSTYASWWIRHAITRAIADKGRVVRIPVHMLEAYGRVARAKQALLTRTGCEASLEELEGETYIPRDKLKEMQDHVADPPLSLDRPVGDEDGYKFLDHLQEEGAVSPFDHLANNRWKDEVRRLLTMLTPIESRVIRWRFGLESEDELTLKEIGDKYGLSRERIRQIQGQALAKMRRLMRSSDH